jgi:hypothetical protein
MSGNTDRSINASHIISYENNKGGKAALGRIRMTGSSVQGEVDGG